MSTFKYLAYGSNMFFKRLEKRCPSSKTLGKVQLPNYELKWHKKSTDGSGKCDIVRKEGAQVWGVLYEIAKSDSGALDKAEGVGYGYKRKKIKTEFEGETLTVDTYIATKTDEHLKPYTWYKECVVKGAKEHSLPDEYISKLEAVDAIIDSDKKREDCNKCLD